MSAPTVLLLAAVSGLLLNMYLPWPDDQFLVLLTKAVHPRMYEALRWTWIVMLYTTPAIAFAAIGSQVYIFSKRRRSKEFGVLPPFPVARDDEPLRVVLGEVQHPRKIQPGEHPQWLVIPERGLYTGIAAFGAIGSGKTQSVLYPVMQQILHWRKKDKARRVGGIVLEVKGDFCHQIKRVLREAARQDDYIELSMDGSYRYNPLENEQEPFALAYSIASLLNQLYGKSKEPFWQQAYTNLVKFIILLYKTVDGYCTLFDVYQCAIDRNLLRAKVAEGDALFALRAPQAQTYVAIDPMVEIAHGPELAVVQWEKHDGRLRTPINDEVLAVLDHARVPYLIEADTEESPADLANESIRLAQFQAVKRWLHHDWLGIDPKLRTSIVEGISVWISLFDSSPKMKEIFCPPKECYDPVANKDGVYGRPLPALRDLIEGGKVLALNFPVGADSQVGRQIACMVKQDYQRAMLNRIPRMAEHPEQYFRESVFLCDEYHQLATVGQSDPNGDEKFFALSRQAKCIPIVATQSIASLKETLPADTWRVLLQGFRTKLFLTVADDFTAKIASDLAGRHEELVASYSISESGNDVRVSSLSGRAQAHKAGVTISKSYNPQMRPMFETSFLMSLPNYIALSLVYDGAKPLPPQLVLLKPHFLDRAMSYFTMKDKGLV